MNILEEYKQMVAQTIGPTTNLACVGLGVAGEAGEAADYIKKMLYHGITPDYDKLDKEFGDVLWYVAAYCHIMELPLEQLMFKNIEKLRKRYPNGFIVGGGKRDE